MFGRHWSQCCELKQCEIQGWWYMDLEVCEVVLHTSNFILESQAKYTRKEREKRKIPDHGLTFFKIREGPPPHLTARLGKPSGALRLWSTSKYRFFGGLILAFSIPLAASSTFFTTFWGHKSTQLIWTQFSSLTALDNTIKKQSKIDEACDKIKSILKLPPPQCGHKSWSRASLCVSTQKGSIPSNQESCKY